MAGVDPKRWAGKFGIESGPVPIQREHLTLTQPPIKPPRYAPHSMPDGNPPSGDTAGRKGRKH